MSAKRYQYTAPARKISDAENEGILVSPVKTHRFFRAQCQRAVNDYRLSSTEVGGWRTFAPLSPHFQLPTSYLSSRIFQPPPLQLVYYPPRQQARVKHTLIRHHQSSSSCSQALAVNLHPVDTSGQTWTNPFNRYSGTAPNPTLVALSLIHI